MGKYDKPHSERLMEMGFGISPDGRVEINTTNKATGKPQRVVLGTVSRVLEKKDQKAQLLWENQ